MDIKLTQRVKNIKPSATLKISARAKQLMQAGEDVINLSAGELDFDTPVHIKEEAISAIREGFTKYTPSSGITELKKAVVEKFRRDNGLNYEPSQIVVSCGAKHSIFNLLQALCQKGDEVIIPCPYWVSYPEMVNLCGAKVVFLKTSKEKKFKIDAAVLKKALTKRAKLLILNSPSNPTGCVYTKEELEALSEVIVKHNIFVISDEIYEKLIYSDSPHISIASLGRKIYEQTIVVNGVSKSYSMTGWRIGYVGAHKRIAEALDNLQSHSTSNPTSISQMASLAALTQNQECISKFVNELKKRRDVMYERLNAIDGLEPFLPEGAFYIFCGLGRNLRLKSTEFASKLLDEEKVAIVPGKEFGNDNYLRFSFTQNIDRIEGAMARLKRFIGRL